MIHECIKCKQDFLTEANPYIVYPKPSGIELQCLNCYDKQLELKDKQIEILKEAVDFYASRENWSSEKSYGTILNKIDDEDTDERDSFYISVSAGKLARKALEQVNKMEKM